MSSTGGKPSVSKLEPLTLSMDQLVRPKKQISTPVISSKKDGYSAKLASERDKLFQDELTFADFTDTPAQILPNLGLQLHEMVRPTPSNTNHLKGAFHTKEKSDNFNKNLTSLHPFGEPPMGWMPKEQLMSLVRMIDTAKRRSNTEPKNGNV